MVSGETTAEVTFQWILSYCNIKKTWNCCCCYPWKGHHTAIVIKHINSTFTETWVQQWATSNTVLNRINDITIYKGIKHQHQTFGAKLRIGHIITESYLYKLESKLELPLFSGFTSSHSITCVRSCRPSSIYWHILQLFNMALGGIDQPSKTYLAFGKYLKGSGNTIRKYVSYL